MAESNVGSNLSTVRLAEPVLGKAPIVQLQENLALRSDALPVLLLPLRIETRFVRIKHIAREPQGALLGKPSIPDTMELWVRIFPDDLAVSSHEIALMPSEIELAKAYWQQVYELGGNETKLLGRWRAMAQQCGPQRAAYILKTMTPTNYASTSRTFSGPPSYPTPAQKDAAWTQTATSFVMPDRFVAIGYNGVDRLTQVGERIDPLLQLGFSPEGDSFQQEAGTLKVPDGMQWMTDFKVAVQKGVGLRIKLEGKWQQGMSRLVVLGLMLGNNETASQQLLTELLNHHRWTSGFSLVPQGMATNNTAKKNSGLDQAELDVDAAFAWERGAPLVNRLPDMALKTDGQWFAEALGLEDESVIHLPHADGKDIAEAMAMNRALVPATLKFAMRQMMHPVFTDQTVSDATKFFKTWVLGRGHVPAFRVGNQPYGVVLASAFSKWQYKTTDTLHAFPKNLLTLLKLLDTQWKQFAGKVKTVTGSDVKSLDAKFLKIISLHPSSVAFFQRIATGPDFLYGLETFYATQGPPAPGAKKNIVDISASLKANGFTIPAAPFLAKVVNIGENRDLKGPVVDTAPLSETNPLQALKGSPNNYLNWLLNATHATLRTEDFTKVGAALDTPKPNALLYLLLRHALLLEYANISFDLLMDKGVVTASDRFLPEYVNVSTRPLTPAEKDALRIQVENKVLQSNGYTVNPNGGISVPLSKGMRVAPPDRGAALAPFVPEVEATYQQQVNLIEKGPVLWGDVAAVQAPVPNMPMGTYIDSLLTSNSPKTAGIKEIRSALQLLEKVPTARLERMFAEHVDLCSYRLDSWKTGLFAERLFGQRLGSPATKSGLTLGAFGWLENLKPSSVPGIEVREIVKDGVKPFPQSYTIQDQSPFVGQVPFSYLGTDTSVALAIDPELGRVMPAIRRDPANMGFVHTPSINQATTAAILRAGYKADPNGAMAVNLNSARVRMALYYLEGVRNGQPLGALLGYRFERSLHELKLATDDGKMIALDQYLLQLRTAFPLVAGKVVQTGNGAIETTEARNVIDGLKAVESLRKDGEAGFNAKVWGPVVNPNDLAKNAVKNAFLNIVKQLTQELDAFGDLCMAEAVYQLSHGRKDRANAVLRALNAGGAFPEMEVLRTPRSGKSLTHRVILHLKGDLEEAIPWNGNTILSKTEPRLSTFVGQQLPDPAKICFNVSIDITDQNGAKTTKRCKVTLKQLVIEPLEFLILAGRQLGNPNATALSNRIGYFAKRINQYPDDGKLSVSFTDRTGFSPDEKSFVDIIAHLEALLDVLHRTRHLRPSDLLLPNGALSTDGLYDINELKGRVSQAIEGPVLQFALKPLSAQLRAAANMLRSSGSDTDLNGLRSYLLMAAAFNIEGAIPERAGFLAEDKAAILAQTDLVISKLDALYRRVSKVLVNDNIATDVEVRIAAFQSVAKQLFGSDFLLLPRFAHGDAATFGLAKAHAESGMLLSYGVDFPVEEWFQGVSRVRPAMADLLRFSVMSEALHGQDRLPRLRPLQLPHTLDENQKANALWAGIAFPETYELPGDVLSLVNAFPASYNVSAKQVGLVLDEWSEVIPNKHENTGLAMHANQPNAQAPQSLLLCVAPQETGKWNWETLLAIVNETLDAAKQRAVDPTLVDETNLGQFLPMIYASLTSPTGYPTLDFARSTSSGVKGVFGSKIEYVQTDIS